MSPLARAYDVLHALLGVLTAAFLLFIAFGTSADIIMRNVGLGAIGGMLEYGEYALFLATFLGAPWVLRHGAHVRVDILIHTLPRAAARWLDLLADLIGLVVCCVLLYFAVAEAWIAYVEGHRIIKMFIVPSWQIFVVVAVALALLILEFARRAIIGLTARRPD